MWSLSLPPQQFDSYVWCFLVSSCGDWVFGEDWHGRQGLNCTRPLRVRGRSCQAVGWAPFDGLAAARPPSWVVGAEPELSSTRAQDQKHGWHCACFENFCAERNTQKLKLWSVPAYSCRWASLLRTGVSGNSSQSTWHGVCVLLFSQKNWGMLWFFKAIQVCWLWCDWDLQFGSFLLVSLVELERQLGSVCSVFAPETCLWQRKIPAALVEEAGN